MITTGQVAGKRLPSLALFDSMTDFITLMKHELLITVIISLLLFVKIGRGMKNESLLTLIQVLLLLNGIAPPTR